MRVPYCLLRLLPMWDYICPRCKREVSKNSHKCLYCGEYYGVPIKVPPKLLKDKKALEEYVHKKIFPKISSIQREYLTQFFTEIFSDGFESGNFDAWTGTTIGTGCTLEVQTANPHHGTYSVKCIFAAWQNIVVCYKDFSSEYSTIFARMYVRFNNFPTADTRYSRVLGFRSASAQWIATIRVYNDAGTVKWGIEYRSGANFLSQLLDSPTPTANTWYCIELKEVVHATAGETRFYLDGVEKLTQTNLDSDNVGNVKTLRCGQHSDAGLSAEMTTYFDCVVAADAYIGEEGAPPAGQQLYTLINLMGY